MHRDTGRPYPCDGCEGLPSLTEDIRESWELFARAVTRERGKDSKGNEYEVFSVKWDFVNVFLTHAEVEDTAETLADLIDLERAMNG